MIKNVICIALVGCSLTCFGQDGKLHKPATVRLSSVDASQPVTHIEANAAIARATKALEAVVHIKYAAPGLPQNPKPVTREETAELFYKVYAKTRPEFKFTPRPIAVPTKRLTNKSRVVPELIRTGMLAPIGPVAAGSGVGLTTKEFGDALGYLLTRLADLTHMPSSKWSPNLHN